MGKRLLFISNNSSKSRADYRSKFTDFGMEAKEEEIFNSGYATAMYLKARNFQKAAYVVGEEGLAKELIKAGIKCRGVKEHSFIPDKLQSVLDVIDLDLDIGAVVVGFDSTLSYAKLAFANHQLEKNPECLFIATNIDSTLPTPKGLVPGGGANVTFLQYSSGRSPIVIGKPEPIVLELIKQSYHIDPKRTVMVGDRLDTDIAFGARGGLQTLLVFTGVCKSKDIGISDETSGSNGTPVEVTPKVTHKEEKTLPKYYINSFGDLIDLLK
jgi:4-nitrophenyl phosphatase